MANVPHDVPVVNDIMAPAINSIGTINTTGRYSPTMPATKTPVPNSFRLLPKVSDNSTMVTKGSNSPIPLNPISTASLWVKRL